MADLSTVVAHLALFVTGYALCFLSSRASERSLRETLAEALAGKQELMNRLQAGGWREFISLQEAAKDVDADDRPDEETESTADLPIGMFG